MLNEAGNMDQCRGEKITLSNLHIFEITSISDRVSSLFYMSAANFFVIETG